MVRNWLCLSSAGHGRMGLVFQCPCILVPVGDSQRHKCWDVVQQCYCKPWSWKGSLRVWVRVQERGDLLGQGEKGERKRCNGKHAIKNNPLSYILYSSDNWKWETCEPKAHTSTSMGSPSCLESLSAVAHAVHGEQKGTTIKGEMQSTLPEMSCTLAAQNASWAPHHIPWILSTFPLYFFGFAFPSFFYPRVLEGEAEAAHTVVSTTSPPPSFWFIEPSNSSLPKCPAVPVPSAWVHNPFAINTHQQPLWFYGQGAL